MVTIAQLSGQPLDVAETEFDIFPTQPGFVEVGV